MVQLILEAAQGASAGLYPDTIRQTERCDLPEGAHRMGTDGFVAGAAFAALARASGPTKRSRLAHAQKSILPFHHFKSEVVLAMRRLILLQLFLPLFATVTSAEFQGLAWRTSMQEVLASEGEPINRDKDSLVYELEFGSLPARAFFHFVNNRLAKAGYNFASDHASPDSYLDDFDRIQAILIGKHQEPKDNKIHWINDLYKNDRRNWAPALASEHLVLMTTWETKESKITHVMSGRNGKIIHWVRYESLSLDTFAFGRSSPSHRSEPRSGPATTSTTPRTAI